MNIASVAIIGVSGFGNVHYRDLLREVGIGRAKASAAVIINPEEEAEKVAELKAMGCEIFSDYKEMLTKWKGRIDICVIPTSIHLHRDMTIAALEAGANVLVEKPAAATVQDVDLMIEAEKKSGKFVAVGFQTNFSRQYERVKEAILAGKIGELQSMKCAAIWPRSAGYYTRRSWAGKVKIQGEWVLDSPFNNALAHWVMLMCSLAGKMPYDIAQPTAVTAELYRSRPIENCDTCSIRIETNVGVPLLFFATHSAASSATKDPLLVIKGTKGEIQWPAYQHADLEGASSCTIPYDGEGPLREAIFDTIFRKVKNPKSPICGLGDARAHVLVCNGAHESSPIIDIPQGNLRSSESDGESWIAISSIESIFRDAMKKELLLSELKVPWAKAGQRFSLEGYKEFSGGALAKK